VFVDHREAGVRRETIGPDRSRCGPQVSVRPLMFPSPPPKHELIRPDSFFHRMSEAPPYESAFPISSAPNVTPKSLEGIWEDQ